MFVHTAFRLVALAAFLAAYTLSSHLPNWTSYENGPIEMAQNLVLLIGGLQAISYGTQAKEPWRYLWFAAAPVWFICLGRELSWGAVFLPPIKFAASGPFYTSAVLPYKALVAPLVGLLLLFSFGLFVRFKLWTVGLLASKSRQLPVIEVAMAGVAVLLMTAAENHMNLSLEAYLSYGQIFEETIELSAYLFLLAAQHRLRLVAGNKW
ncbi:hypothetical protein MRBLMR1_002318 [Neorhizobium sp. LMR1-1-1.1]